MHVDFKQIPKTNATQIGKKQNKTKYETEIHESKRTKSRN